MQARDPDAQLVLAFRGEALSALYRRWAGLVLRFLERMVRERATAEELMQETFVRFHGARDRYAADPRFSTWLLRIARNLAPNELDRERNMSDSARDAAREQLKKLREMSVEEHRALVKETEAAKGR